MAERLYFKLWHLWWTSESHEDLGEDPISIGPVLMSFCRWDPGRDNGWAVTEKGHPVTCGALARRARWSGRGASERVAAALRELERVGTAELRSDGAWGLPKFGKWQESASAAKMRKSRAKPKYATDVPSHGGHSDHPCDLDVPPLEGDEEGAGEQQHASHAGQPSATKRDIEPKTPDPHKPAIDRVLAALHDARCSVKPGLTRLRKREHIRARLADGSPVEHLLAVIDFAADECRRKPEALQWLDATTPFRPKNWESRLARAQAWQATSRHSGPRLDLDATALDRKRAEAEAYDREHRPWLFQDAPGEPS